MSILHIRSVFPPHEHSCTCVCMHTSVHTHTSHDETLWLSERGLGSQFDSIIAFSFPLVSQPGIPPLLFMWFILSNYGHPKSFWFFSLGFLFSLFDFQSCALTWNLRSRVQCVFLPSDTFEFGLKGPFVSWFCTPKYAWILYSPKTLTAQTVRGLTLSSVPSSTSEVLRHIRNKFLPTVVFWP